LIDLLPSEYRCLPVHMPDHESNVSSPGTGVPVLLVIFNRPEHAARTFARIRAARPPQLFIHADGPRSGRSDEADKCVRARRATEQVDWDCEVHRLYREQNLGCGLGVASAVTWFFEQVEEGVILEDDCTPTPGFFHFCETMLKAHRHSTSVMHVAGMGFNWKGLPAGSAAFFSPLPFIWGWATWRRAWNHYRFTLPPSAEAEMVLKTCCANRKLRDYWRAKFDGTRAGEILTWDYQWVFTLWACNGIAVTPTRSLIENIGFGADSTHTISAAVGYASLSIDAKPACAPVASPDPHAALKAIFREIFEAASPKRFDDFFRKPAWLWILYLGLRHRIWARTPKSNP
jgi:hypothetical protein